MNARPRILIVAGHDQSGAGIDADRAALAALDVEPLIVVTARTDQDAQCVRSIGARDPSAWFDEAVALAAITVAALKFGLLPGSAHIEAAAHLVCTLRRENPSLPVVLDPVICASSGGRFLDASAVERMRGSLLGAGVVLTPNLSEAAELALLPLARLENSRAARAEAAHILLGLGARAVVIKGGHGVEDPALDFVVDEEGNSAWIEHRRLAGAKVRGSGCRFASRLAAELACGKMLETAVETAGCAVLAELERAAGEQRT